MKEPKGVILSHNHRRGQGVAQGPEPPQFKCHQ